MLEQDFVQQGLEILENAYISGKLLTNVRHKILRERCLETRSAGSLDGKIRLSAPEGKGGKHLANDSGGWEFMQDGTKKNEVGQRQDSLSGATEMWLLS